MNLFYHHCEDSADALIDDALYQSHRLLVGEFQVELVLNLSGNNNSLRSFRDTGKHYKLTRLSVLPLKINQKSSHRVHNSNTNSNSHRLTNGLLLNGVTQIKHLG